VNKLNILRRRKNTIEGTRQNNTVTLGEGGLVMSNLKEEVATVYQKHRTLRNLKWCIESDACPVL